MIYLDYNATSPLLPNVRAAMNAVEGLPLNPASAHAYGRQAKKLLEDARANIASAVGAFPNEVLFTGSCTEANNMVLRAFAPTHPLVVSAIEHASILKTTKLLGGTTVPVDANGIIDLDLLEEQLKNLGKPALVSVMLANNENGVIQPMADVSRIAHKYGALVHCDAVQALGKITVDWGLLGVDMLSICAHKAGGPVGIGALLIRNDLPITSLLTGGSQELGRRAGTENIPAIVGFGALVKDVAHCPDAPKWLAWREWLEREIMEAAPEAIIFGKGTHEHPSAPPPLVGGGREEGASPLGAPLHRPPTQPSPARGEGVDRSRLPNTLQVSMPGVKSETQLMHFDLAGYGLSSGSACSSGRVIPSHVLLSMGYPVEVAETAIRISFGWGTTEAEVKAFAEAWKSAYARLGKRPAA